MHLRRVVLSLALPLACTTSPSDSDATTDILVTTSGSTSGSTSEPATTSGTTTADDPTTSAATTDASTSTSTTTTDPTTSSGSTTDTTTGAVLEQLPPIDSVDALEAWLAGGAYREWAVESAIHPSTGPHSGNVLTYVNAIALQSLADADPEHLQDSATVKELYGDSLDTIIGYAVSRKTAPQSEGGDLWYWYERVNDTTYGGELGTTLCTGCHGGGADYILTPYPLQ